ncbi:putative protein phosphatase 2C 8 [Canna indica]|uniref:protein-serine/threonine phosphatase n=1 Tax=Canna indica TaxID=4628 RepID=A0AAQ3K7E5_9LILI|nr:putative protein phosphatase 2C 8 [Canna indica]
MEGPPSANTNTNANHSLLRRRRRRLSRLHGHNPGFPKRIYDEGESSRSAASRGRTPAPDNGAENTETETAPEEPPLVAATPPLTWRARDPRCLAHGSVSLLGRRRDMEDTSTAMTGLAAGAYGYFAVFDGHGGAMVAQACRDRLHVAVAEEVGRRRAVGERDGMEMWKQAVVAGFAKVDAEVLAEARELQLGTVGSTALVALVAEKWIMIANCGDSRAVLSCGGVPVALSTDHKPDRPDELRRVEALGGKVLCWDCPRVFGVLSTSRSFGDYILKPYVSSEPEFTMIKRTQEDEFLILASDGLWDVISSDMACRVISRCLEGQVSENVPSVVANSAARDAASLLARLAICRGSFDNVTVVVVVL